MEQIRLFSACLISLGELFACGYGVWMMKRSFRPSYFKIAICGMFAAFLAQLFCLVLILGGSSEAFHLGVFGNAAVYLFYIVANRAYVPPELEERSDKRICLPALVAALLPCAVFACSAVFSGAVGAYITESIYILSMGIAVYFAVKSARNKYHNPFRTAITPYNLCLCALVYLKAATELVTVCGSESAIAVCTVITTVITVPITVIMLPLLKRGLKPWEI